MKERPFHVGDLIEMPHGDGYPSNILVILSGGRNERECWYYKVWLVRYGYKPAEGAMTVFGLSSSQVQSCKVISRLTSEDLGAISNP